MIIDKRINEAILRYVENIGGAGRLQDTIGVSAATAFHIGKGRSKLIQSHIWNKLQPLITPYMQATDTPIAAPNNHNESPARMLLMERIGKLSDDQVDSVLAYVLALPKAID